MKNGKLHRVISQNLLRLVFIIMSLIVAVPIMWAIITSFKTSAEYLADPWALPQKLEFQNYVNAIVRADMGDYFINSIVITLITLIFVLILSIPAAYALSRFKFRFSKLLNLLFMAGLFINGACLLIPIFLTLKSMHALDNRLMLCVVYAATSLPFNIYLLGGFMRGVSPEYEEAARIDGCGYFQTLFKIVVPMCKPALVTVLLFGFMSYWNEYNTVRTLLSTPEKRTLSVGLRNLMVIQKYATDWGALFAGLVIVMLPTMLFYAIVQKRLTDGMTIGGLKG